MIGKKILNYEIKSLLGEGGMGNVYLAEHVQLGRKVAIKVLHQQLVRNEALRARFKNEAATMAHLQHTNIVTLYDYVEEPDGLYLIMEYVEGISMEEYIRSHAGPIPSEKAIPMMRQILDAVAYAHHARVVHRDIKPANILLTKNGNVKILDFGIAKLFSDAGNLTKTGTQMGTVFYMSPEQVKGVNVDYRTDIYSLGVTLFQMLTGVGPYFGITTEFEVYNKIVNEPMKPASSVYPGVPAWLDAVIFKATEKNPDNRFISCEQFSAALTGQFPAGHTMVYPQQQGNPPMMAPQYHQQPSTQFQQPQNHFQQPINQQAPQYASTQINSSGTVAQPPKKTGKAILIVLLIFVVLGIGSVSIYLLTRPSPEEIAHKVSNEYFDLVRREIKEGMNSIEIKAGFENCKTKIAAQLSEAHAKFADDVVKTNRFDNYYNHAIDSVETVVNQKINDALALQLLPYLWVKVGEQETNNYLFDFHHDSVLLPNRKGGYPYVLKNEILSITGKGSTQNGKLDFTSLEEFTLTKDGGETIVFKVATAKDSMVGNYAASDDDWQWNSFTQEYYNAGSNYNLEMKPNGELYSPSHYKYDIVNGEMIWYEISGGEIYRNFGHWSLDNMNKLKLTNAAVSTMVRVRTKQIDAPDFIFMNSKAE